MATVESDRSNAAPQKRDPLLHISRQDSRRALLEKRHQRESLASLALSALVAAVVGVVVWMGREPISQALSANWRELLFWGGLVVLVNLIHVDLEPLQFTLDIPLLLALALLYPPPVAACVALVSSFDVREFRRRVSFSRAVFNRCQVSLSVFAASAVFHSVAAAGSDWWTAVGGTVIAVLVFYALNTGLVAVYVGSRTQTSPLEVLRHQAIGRPLQYALTYFGYGVLGLVLARLFEQVGAWSAVLFLIPIVVAHMALVRADRLQSLANRLQSRGRLLELLSDRIADERRDERVRIASDLHDDVLQSLIRMSQLGRFLRQAAPKGTQAERDASELVETSDHTMSILRDVVGDLRESPVGRGGLVRTLRGLAQDMNMEWRVPVSVEGPDQLEVPAGIQLIAYHVAKEGMLNALKHGQPSHVHVRFSVPHSTLCVDIWDDGAGFRPDRVDESSHFGLGLMRERVQMHGGTLRISSNLGRGTHVAVELPTNG
jgi:signal transduction histidine kinase